LRDTVRQFVGERILPDVAAWFEEGILPKDLAKEMGALGFFGMHLEGYGCAGTSAVEYGLACLELEAGDSGARSFVSVQGSLAMFPIWKYGSELVGMMMAINRGMLVALHLGRMKDSGTLSPEQVSFGKMDNVRAALEVARSARGVLGANGITLEYPVIRHMNNLESVLTYEGTHEVHTLVMGNAITGIDAFRAGSS
jgi:alkylation response protein AidB-like acyl-CoA dehydrogenase